MELIQWNDRLKLGIEVVDRQHERLVEIINRLNEAMTQGRGADMIGEILDELIIYTATHFSTEEKYFAQFEYADAVEHKLEHDALIEKVSAFADDLEKAQGGAGDGIAAVSGYLVALSHDGNRLEVCRSLQSARIDLEGEIRRRFKTAGSTA